MKLLFDQNLSPRLVSLLSAEFPGSHHVRDLNLASASDPDIWKHAASNEFVIVSKDVDFQNRALLYGHPPKVIWVRLGNYSTAQVAILLQSRMQDIEQFESDPLAAFLALR